MSDPTAQTTTPFKIIGPGLLVAATGVGAGDLATGAFSGAKLGVVVLWAVILGAAIKFVLNEGLARWQLSTETTVLEGTARYIGRPAIVAFLVYLSVWSFFVGSALMSACGVAAHAIFPIGDAADDKIVYGIAHSAVAVVMVLLGGYRLFEKVMSVCIAVMFLTVVISAIAVGPDWGDVLSGLFIPTIPDIDALKLRWTVGLMGGVGGTVTVLCYGYWIREEGRSGLKELQTCRLDLMTGYAVTAVFGICMVILGSQLEFSGGKGATLVVQLADRLEETLGTAGKLAFLGGAWGAVFSSTLGVWQSVPYLFEDCVRLLQPGNRETDSSRGSNAKSTTYWLAMIGIAVVPATALLISFQRIQLAYAVVGACFMPILAIALIFLNGSRKRVGESAVNSRLTTTLLVFVVLFFTWAGFYEARDRIDKYRQTVDAVSRNSETIVIR